MKTPDQRLFFLDWMRILAFLILILYHVGMYYVSWDWHVKSPSASDALEPFMLLSSPWRLGLLFLVSGAACSFMLAARGGSAFVRQRSWRLLLPLLFGMLVIVPPQPYFEVVEKVAYQGSYLNFMQLYVSGYGGFCRLDDCLDLPTWNHLWFLAYLWVYCLLLAGLAGCLGERLERAAHGIAGMLHGWKLLVLPALALGAIRALLAPHFPSTHGLVDDWYNHAHYLTLFLLGALLARARAAWPRLEQMCWPALGLALGCWAALIIYYALPDSLALDPAQHHWRVLMRIVYAACGWSAIVAACGFAHRHLNTDSRQRAYLTQAVFPVYIVHQTLIVAIAHLIKPAAIAAPVEFVVLVILTLCLSFAMFELVRRVPVLRPLFGLGRPTRAKAPRGAPNAERPATANC